MNFSKITERLTELPENYVAYYDKTTLVRKYYSEVWEDVKVVKSKLQAWGVQKGMRVGVLAENCYEWIVFELALFDYPCVSVCFPPQEFSQSSLQELGDKYALHLLYISSNEAKKRKISTLPEWVVLLDKEEDRTVKIRETKGMHPSCDPGILQLEEDIFTIVFSSGTSGRLKCLKISKRGTANLISSFGDIYPFQTDDAIFVFLPLSIYQQRWMIYTALWHGFNLCLADLARLFQSLKQMQPTIIGAPPLFYETIENRFRNLPKYQQLAFTTLAKAASLIPIKSVQTQLVKKVFSPFHKALGGRIRIMLIGAAPVRLSTLNLFSLMKLPLFEGYGLTETGYITLNVDGRNQIGTVGKSLIEGSIFIAEDGEIIYETDKPLCTGYLYCDEDEQAKTYLGNNKIATGDIGKFDENGYLHLIGRKKEIIITRGGYKIHPESLEKKLEAIPMVSRAVVFGGEDLPGLTALISIQGEENPQLEKHIQNMVDGLNKTLPPSTKIDRLTFTTTQFSVDNGLLNRNLKVNRRGVFQHFENKLSYEVA